MNKKGDFGSILSIIFIILVLFIATFWGFMFYRTAKVKNSNCVQEIIENYCEEKGYSFSEVYAQRIFICKTDERDMGIEYRFLEGEIKECLRSEK